MTVLGQEGSSGRAVSHRGRALGLQVLIERATA